MSEQIDLKLLLESAILHRREDNSERSGDVAKVYLTPSAPAEFKDNFPDGTAWLVNEIPLRVRATPNSEEEFEVMPAWIVYEGCDPNKKDVKEYSASERDAQDRKQAIKNRIDKMSKKKGRIKKDPKFRENLRKLSKTESSVEEIIEDVIDNYLGKGEISEVGYDVLAYNAEDYSSPNSAYQEFVKSSKEVGENGTTDVKTARNFLRQVYKGGNNAVRFKEFVKLLVKKGITVTDRREHRVADLEIVGEGIESSKVFSVLKKNIKKTDVKGGPVIAAQQRRGQKWAFADNNNNRIQMSLMKSGNWKVFRVQGKAEIFPAEYKGMKKPMATIDDETAAKAVKAIFDAN